MPNVCEHCNGSGNQYGAECETCDNNGWVDDPSDGGTMTCPECLGDSGDKCKICEGEG